MSVGFPSQIEFCVNTHGQGSASGIHWCKQSPVSIGKVFRSLGLISFTSDESPITLSHPNMYTVIHMFVKFGVVSFQSRST